jgi:periplasmic copper chaperone A
MRTFSRTSTRVFTTGAMTLAMGSLAVALAASASAHVSVNSTDARQDGFGKVTVRVPGESPTAGTVKVAVSMPADLVLRSVRVMPHTGWTATAPKVALAKPVKQGDKMVTETVQTITWTANKGVSIKNNEFDEFEFSVGQLPADKKSVSFIAIETYSDGKIVKWDQPTTPGAEEPEKPAPELKLLPAAVDEKTTTVAPPAAKTGNDSVARGIGAGAAVVALGGVGLGLKRKRSATS